MERPPVWIMRQAGRYLPEYHEEKERAGGFMGLCKIPEHGVEVTLQPIRRFGFDAAILFSDILIPAEAMGIELTFAPGPIIANPVQTLGDVASLTVPDPDRDLPYVMEILHGLRSELPPETTLIGFAGAPFTVACYLVAEAAGRGQFETIRRMIYEAPEIIHALVDKITDTTVLYLSAQIAAGAEVVQLFDSSAGLLPPHLFESFALEPAKRILDAVSGTAPTIYFAPGAMAALHTIAHCGADVIGLDWRVSIEDARRVLGDHLAVQGNLDPACLLGTEASVTGEVNRILSENRGRPGHIFNLGHGILKETPIANVETLVSTVKGAL